MAMPKIAKMFYRKRIVVKIYPSDEQRRIIAVNDDASRFIYNKLVERNKLYRMRKAEPLVPVYHNHIAYLDWSLQSAENMKTAYSFLAEPEIDSCVISTTKSNFSVATTNMFERHTGRPQFKVLNRNSRPGGRNESAILP